MKGIYTITGAALVGVLLALGGCAPRNDVQPAPYYGGSATPAYGNSTYGSTGCTNCGTVTNIEPIPEGSDSNVAGAVIGAVVGAAVGHQFGGGRGQTAATIAGAAGGAYAGSKIQGQYANGDQYDYRVTLRMDNGTTETLVQDDPPNFGVGAHVQLNGSSGY